MATNYQYDSEKKDPENYVDDADSEINGFSAIIAEGARLPHLAG
jgi:hypothetical protein